MLCFCFIAVILFATVQQRNPMEMVSINKIDDKCKRNEVFGRSLFEFDILECFVWEFYLDTQLDTAWKAGILCDTFTNATCLLKVGALFLRNWVEND